MFIFIPNVDQGETSGLSNGVWAVSAHAVPVLSPALTACGAVPGASPRWCVCTSRAAIPPTAAATGSACPGAAAATAPSGPAPPATPWTAAPPTAACTASAAPVNIPGEYPSWWVGLLPLSCSLWWSELVSFKSRRRGWAAARGWKLQQLQPLCCSFPFCPRVVL